MCSGTEHGSTVAGPEVQIRTVEISKEKAEGPDRLRNKERETMGGMSIRTYGQSATWPLRSARSERQTELSGNVRHSTRPGGHLPRTPPSPAHSASTSSPNAPPRSPPASPAGKATPGSGPSICSTACSRTPAIDWAPSHRSRRELAALGWTASRPNRYGSCSRQRNLDPTSGRSSPS